MKRLIMSVLFLLSVDVHATISLFQYIEPSGDPPPPSPGLSAEYAISPTIDSFSESTPTVTMVLPGHPAPVTMTRLRSESRESGFSWVGNINGYVTPSVVTVDGDHLLARLFSALGDYEIRVSSAGASLGIIDSTFRIVDETVTAPIKVCCARKTTGGTNSSFSAEAAKAAANAHDPIRVLVGYTTAARAISAGGISQIQAKAQYAIDLNNQIYRNSQAPEVRLELAGTIEVNHPDPWPYLEFLDNVRLDADLRSARNALYADVVVVLVEDAVGVSGVAYGNFSLDPAFAETAYALSEHAVTGLFVFAHEVGHLEGMGHWELSAPAAFVWGHPKIGFPDTTHSQGFLTVMSSGAGTCGGTPPCYLVPYFSNPDMVISDPPFQGRTVGDAGTRNNALVARATSLLLSGFRDDRLLVDGFEQ